MDLFKKNPVFCILCIVAVLVFAGGTTLVVLESGKLAKSKKQVEKVERQIEGLLQANPAPTVENMEAAEQNVKALNAKLLNIREELQRGGSLSLSTDGSRVMSGLQKYISTYRKRMSSHVNADEVKAPIVVPAEFAFGFDPYLKESRIDDDAVIVPALDKQRQVLSYILDQLIAADPVGIQAVERELLKPGSDDDGGFVISPALTARVPDAIDTLAFRVTFTGYTPVLRKFLNNLAQFELPVVVRSVEVKGQTDAEKASGSNRAASQQIDDIFSVFGGASSDGGATTETTTTQTETAVISANVSSFTVTLEFIEIILPSNSEENPS